MAAREVEWSIFHNRSHSISREHDRNTIFKFPYFQFFQICPNGPMTNKEAKKLFSNDKNNILLANCEIVLCDWFPWQVFIACVSTITAFAILCAVVRIRLTFWCQSASFDMANCHREPQCGMLCKLWAIWSMEYRTYDDYGTAIAGLRHLLPLQSILVDRPAMLLLRLVSLACHSEWHVEILRSKDKSAYY